VSQPIRPRFGSHHNCTSANGGSDHREFKTPEEEHQTSLHANFEGIVMTAALYDDAALAPPVAPIVRQAPKPLHRKPFGGDPLVDAAAHLLSIPLRQVYAVLWRVGLIEVTA
jgi:hypothetical protein